MSASPLRIGWIGCGTHANEMLLPQLTRHDVVIAALCDNDAARLAATGRRYGVAPDRLFSHWDALLDAGGVDALGLAVGPQLHYEIGLAAIARALPLFIEKPPAPTARQAQDQLRKG